MSKARYNKITGAKTFTSEDFFDMKGHYSYTLLVYIGNKRVGYAYLI